MPDGILGQVGTPSDVFRRPADLGVAEFAGAAVVVDADVVDGSVSPDPGPLHVMSGSDAGRA
jgi:ABC-type Fe3+/spermidine/putrescine transport system ATPase subunit